MSGSLLAFFHLCLVSILLSAPSILKSNEVLEKLFLLVTLAITPGCTVYVYMYSMCYGHFATDRFETIGITLYIVQSALDPTNFE